MAGRLSFSIAVNMLTDGVKRGTNNIKSAFASMQMNMMALAAAFTAGGLGLSNFVSKLIDTARETNRVNMALKNVSTSSVAFLGNQKFLIDMANKYGIDINILTGNYSKFTAAANASGVSVDNQRKIFESMSRATTAMGLSAQDTDLAFLAITQMMSKGKISSEELRRQLGEKMPQAMAAMAKAVGVPISGLDKILKKGELLSADILPKFADALNSMIPNVNTDNIETSLNRLKNSFVEFTNLTGIQTAYKAAIDYIASLFRYLSKNMKSIIVDVVAFISGIVLGKLVNIFLVAFAKSQRAAMLAASKSAKAAGVAFDEMAWRAKSTTATIGVMFKTLGVAIKSAFLSILPMAIITAITSLIGYLYNAAQETKRIKNIFSDYRQEAEKVTHLPEIEQLNSLYKIVLDTNSKYEDRKRALDSINSILGTSFEIDKKSNKVSEDINKAIQKRINLLKAQAEVQYYSQKVVETQDKINELNRAKKGKVSAANTVNSMNASSGGKMWLGAAYASNEVDKINSEIAEASRVLADANARLNNAVKAGGVPDTSTSTVIPLTDEDNKKKTDAQKTEEEYKKNLDVLNEKLKLNFITQSEYNEAFDKLNKDALIEASTLQDGSKVHSEYLANLKKQVANPTFDETNAAFEKIKTEYEKKATDLTNQLSAGYIDQKKYNEANKDLTTTTMEQTSALLGAKAATNEFYNNLKKSVPLTPMPEFKNRDTTFDYKKTDAEIASESLDTAKDNFEMLKQFAADTSTDLVEELNNAMLNVKSLGDALKIAELKEDIKEFSKDLKKMQWDNIKDIANSANSIAEAFSSIGNAFTDKDASAWERLWSVWSGLVSIIDGIMSVVDAIEAWGTLTNKLKKAKEAEAIIDSTASATKIGNMTAEATAYTVAKGTEVVASKASTAAAMGEAAARSAAAYAYLPFVGVGLATAQVAALQAMTIAAGLPMYANGGVVGGNSYTGDKILARLNSGELVLNTAQQSSLWGALNQKTVNQKQEVHFKIRGTDLMGVLNNYSTKKSKFS